MDTLIPGSELLLLPCEESSPLPLQQPLPALYEEYGIDLLEHPSLSCPPHLQHTKVPVSLHHSAAELALKAVELLLEQKNKLRHSGQYMLYAYDTTEPSFYLTPALLIKKKLILKQILPLAISHCGSTAFACALEMLDHLPAPTDIQSKDRPSLIVVSDQLARPMPRFWFDSFPKGDAAIACSVTRTRGQWAVIDWLHDEWPVCSNDPYQWNVQQQQEQERILIERSRKLLLHLLQKHSARTARIAYAIIQQLSTTFIQALSSLTHIPIHDRAYAPGCNLLSSDCLFSLYELEHKQQVSSGDYVLLVMAGPLSRVSLLLLQRT